MNAPAFVASCRKEVTLDPNPIQRLFILELDEGRTETHRDLERAIRML